MQIERKLFDTQTETLADKRQVKFVISTDQPDRMGDIVVPSGGQFDTFRRTKTVLWNHDQSSPIASAISITPFSNRVEAVAQFPEPGVSQKSDEIYGLIRSGVVNSASIGFVPLESEPRFPSQPGKGMTIKRWDLLEFSAVSVPANGGATILERSAGAGFSDDTVHQILAEHERKRQMRQREIDGGDHDSIRGEVAELRREIRALQIEVGKVRSS